MVSNDLKLYRYVSFDHFIQMLFSQEIALVSPSKWDDSYEYYWKYYLKSPAGKAQLEAYISQFEGDALKRAETLISLCNFKYDRAFCLCFTRAKDEEVFWNTRSDNKRCIMFATTMSKIYNLFSQDDYEVIDEVKYDLERIQPEDFLSSFHVYSDGILQDNPDELLLHKRTIFSYEKEVRLIFTSVEKSEDEIRKIPIPILSDFIDGIMVHPLANNDYVSLIELLCKQFNIPFLGKSQIYSFNKNF